MKHPVELYPDFSPLSEYLRNIETLAARMGVEVDDLVRDELSRRRKVVYLSGTKKRTGKRPITKG
jgi:hypothetical protein